MNDAVHSEIFFLEDDTLEIKMKHYISPKISVYSTVGKEQLHIFLVPDVELCCGLWVERGEGEVKP